MPPFISGTAWTALFSECMGKAQVSGLAGVRGWGVLVQGGGSYLKGDLWVGDDAVSYIRVVYVSVLGQRKRKCQA